jgi:hypothetical protein
MMVPTRHLLAAALALPLACAGQGEASRARELVQHSQRPVLPNSVSKVQATPSAVLVIPDTELFKGLDLTGPQREALTMRLKTVPFQAFQRTLSERDLLAQRLPSGEIFQVMRPGLAPTLMQQHLPAPGAQLDPCAAPDHTDEEVAALRQVLAAQLRARGGDLAGFNAGYPGTCRRKQLVYLGKAAVVVAR